MREGGKAEGGGKGRCTEGQDGCTLFWRQEPNSAATVYVKNKGGIEGAHTLKMCGGCHADPTKGPHTLKQHTKRCHAHVRKEAVMSSRKMVIARQVSITACPTLSFTRSTSLSRSVPRNTCSAVWRKHVEFGGDRGKVRCRGAVAAAAVRGVEPQQGKGV